MKRWALVMACSLALAFSCGGGDGDDDTTQDTVQEQDTEATDNATGDGYVSVLPDLTGKAFRITMLKGVLPTDIVNPTWEEDIKNYELVLVIHVISHDITTGDAVFEITSCSSVYEEDAEGNRTPVSYQFALEPSVFSTHLDGVDFKISDPIDLSIVTKTVSKPFHVFGVTGYGTFSEDGSRINECWLEGAIHEDETTDLCLIIPDMGSVNFHWFMNLAKICPDFDSTGDELFDSYKFKGYLGAKDETEYFLPGIVPIEITEDCTPDTATCVP